MDRQGKSPAKNKRKKNKKKNQDANGAGRNDQPVQPQVPDGRQEQYARTKNTKPEPVHEQQKGQQHINLGQPNKDKNKATNQAEGGKPAYFNQGILNAESLQTKEIQEMKQTVSDEMDKVAKLLVEQMREINKSQKTFDLRVFGSSEMNPEERAKETQKAILYLAEKMRLREKCAPQTLLDKQEERLQEICFRYDELSKLLQRLEDLEDGGTTHNVKDAHAKPLAARDEITGQEFKEKFLKTCRPKRNEQPCQPTSKHNLEQNTTLTNFEATQNVPGKIYPSEKVLGGSHHGPANIGDGNLVDEVLLRSSPKNEDEKSNASQQQLSSDDSNEFLAFQAFAAPMKFLRRVKKKVGNLFFSPKKEKVKDDYHDGNGDIDIEDRGGALGGAGPVLPQPVQRACVELQNDTAHGNASNKKGLEQILVAPEARVSLTTKTTVAQGREEKEMERGPSRFTTHGRGFRAAENGIAGRNANNVPLKGTLLNLQTPQRNGVEGIKCKTAAEVKQMGVEGRSQGAAPNNIHNIQPSVAVKQKVVPGASQSRVKQMSHLEKRDALSKSATPLPTIPEQNTKQTAPGVKVAGKVNPQPVNIGPNPPLQATAKNVRIQHQNSSVTSASPKNFPVKASIPTKAVGVSASNTASPVASSATGQSKDQKNPPHLAPQKEPRKDAILMTPAQGVATKRKVLEEKTVNSPGQPSQEPKNATAQVALTEKASPASSSRQQGTTKKGSANNKQENHADGCKSPKGILKKERPSSSRVPQIAASLPPSSKANPVVKHPNLAVQKVIKSSNNEADIKQDGSQASSPCERRILKARRRITFEEDKKPEATRSAELSAIAEEVDYETVMPEEFEQAVAEAIEDGILSKQFFALERQSNRPIHNRSYAPLQDIPESSALEVQDDAARETMQSAKKKKNRGKYATGFSKLRKSINCCCEYDCYYCVPAWEWDKAVAKQRRKR